MNKKILIGMGILILLIIPLVYAGNYGAGAYGSGDYNVGEASATPSTETPSGGGGSCVYDWQCTNWFPSECPESGIQERVCANKGTCSGTAGMPNQTQTCEYTGPTEPLFDIFVNILQQEACAGGKIKAEVNLINLGKAEVLDAFMTYWVINENNTLISELKDTRRIKDKETFNIEMKIPKSASEGTYRLYAQIDYENKTAVAGESFEVVGGAYCEIYPSITEYGYFILIAIMFVIIIILIVLVIKRKFKGKKKEDKAINIPKVKKEKKKELAKKLALEYIGKSILEGK